MNLSYDSEAATAKQIGVDEGALNAWLASKVKPTFQSLLKLRDFWGGRWKHEAGLRRSAICRYGAIIRMGGEGRERMTVCLSVGSVMNKAEVE